MDSQDNFVPYFKNRHYKPTKKNTKNMKIPKTIIAVANHNKSLVGLRLIFILRPLINLIP
ncbi:hypothetical protein SAMN05216288_0332 [Pseudomonas punonensis]|uniref:Uncharacterized protein n=1 Tax=Phytopseudomonas punonensis TaxID=1220495 RepID=A0A1M7NJF9_9GAMM|nr:hypothetical protein SAMN05216288_0332 [Pseudomonas punonensis]